MRFLSRRRSQQPRSHTEPSPFTREGPADEATMLAAIDEATGRLAQLTRSTVDTGQGNKVYVPGTENRDAGYPYVRVEDGEFVYRANERGKVLFTKRTRALPEFMRWVFFDVTHSAAQAEARQNKRSGYFDRSLDQRRAWFPVWIDLAERLDPTLGEQVAKHVEQILTVHPYRDR